MKKTRPKARKKIDYGKIKSAYGILRDKRLKAIVAQRMLRDEWK